MASLSPRANHLQPQMPPNPQQPAINRERIAQVYQRFAQLRAQGHSEATNHEMAQCALFLKAVQNASRQQAAVAQAHAQAQPQLGAQRPSQQMYTSTQSAPDPQPPSLPSLSDPVPPNPPLESLAPRPESMPSPPAQVALTESQMATLKSQVAAFRYVQRGLPIPLNLQSAVEAHHEPNYTRAIVKDDIQKVVANGVEQAPKPEGNGVKDENKEAEVVVPTLVYPDGPILERDESSSIYPYNAYTNPYTLLRQPPKSNHPVIIPSVMPLGLDPHAILAERNRYIDARIAQRIRELSDLPSTMGEGGLQPPSQLQTSGDPRYANSKLKALIELKSLRLRDKQRALRSSVVQRLHEAASLVGDRKEYRRYRKQTARDARATEQLERKQRADREHRAKQKHLDYLHTICEHGRNMVNNNRIIQAKAAKLGKAILKFHVDTEREEQKRIEKLSRDRLKALKADDEEAYLKLIDTAKDTRITHLIRQTDSYLEGLAQAVVAQQNDDVHRSDRDLHMSFEQETVPADETMFGATRPDDENPEERGNKVDYYGVAHKISEKVTAQPGMLIGGTLKEYQIKGLQWMVSLFNNKLNGILADEMGLGKTIQTISLIAYLIETKKLNAPYLVVVPLSTLTNWTHEFGKWAPSINTLVYKGGPAIRKQLQGQIRMNQFQVLLTTYEYIIKDKGTLSRVRWVHMIIDEGHRMKNTQSKLSQTLTQHYTARYRLILTGTPLQNNLPELWALLNFVLPKVFNSVKSFDEWFNTPFANTGSQDKIELNEEEQLLIIRRLHKVLRPFLLRRLKKDVESELPDKVEKVIKCKMSALQFQLYKQMKNHGMLFDERIDAKGRQMGVKGLNNTIMQLRKICQHPFVFHSVEDRVNPTKAINSTLIRSAGKVALLDRLLPKLFATGHRVLIFFQMTNIMDILVDYFNYRGWKHLRLDGGTKPEDRSTLLQQFNAPNSEFPLFMLSTRAGGLGLNLQTADTVIIYDSDWNPHADLQAQDRAHRIGQKKAVRIFRFVTEKSIEEVMLSRAKSKLDMDGKVIQAGRFDQKSSAEEQENYLRSMLEADQEEDTDESASMNDDEINLIIARTDEEITIFKRMDGERDIKEDADWMKSGGRGPKPDRLMQFQELPEVYQRDEPKTPPPEIETFNFGGRSQRARKEVIYNDGLTDDQWVAAVEDGDPDVISDMVNDKRNKKSRARAIKDQEFDGSGQSTPIGTDDEPKARKANGKGKGKQTPMRASPPATNKRKRTTTSHSVTPSVDDYDDEPRDSKRRRGEGASMSQAQLKRVFGGCLDAITSLEVYVPAEDGSLMSRQRCELFNALPNKKAYADYYNVIHQPISLTQIKGKVSKSNYRSAEAFRDDLRLMFGNARLYNQDTSEVYQDANEMQKVFESTYARLMAGGVVEDNSGLTPSGSGSGALTPMEVEEPRRRSKSRRNKVVSSDDDEEWNEDD